jgi:PleD family two-component response regulator
MAASRILAYGEDRLVISTRAMILQRAGYDVVQITNATHLLPILEGIVFDLIVVGDSVRHHRNVRVAQKLRERFPGLLILMVQDETDERDRWPSAFVSSTPELLLNAIESLLDLRKKTAASTSAGVRSAENSRATLLHNATGD